ncbi:MAG: hypothetical protein ABSG39_14750, partial [Acidimicrobiales bacterium]
MAPRWQWLLVTLAAVAVSCLVPGSMLAQPPAQADGAAIITTAAPVPTGSECAAVACTRGSPSSSVPLPSVTLAGTIAAGLLVVLALCAFRRPRRGAALLPAGAPSPLFR